MDGVEGEKRSPVSRGCGEKLSGEDSHGDGAIATVCAAAGLLPQHRDARYCTGITISEGSPGY